MTSLHYLWKILKVLAPTSAATFFSLAIVTPTGAKEAATLAEDKTTEPPTISERIVRIRRKLADERASLLEEAKINANQLPSESNQSKQYSSDHWSDWSNWRDWSDWSDWYNWTNR